MKPDPKIFLRDGRAPVPDTLVISRIMSANRAKDTSPEIVLRRFLCLAGQKHFRINKKELPGRPDLAFVREKTAVFVNGCFWHRCLECKNPLPRSNREFWKTKFRRNRARDRRKISELQALGWTCLTIWEHEIKQEPERAAQRVVRLLARRRNAVAKVLSR